MRDGPAHRLPALPVVIHRHALLAIVALPLLAAKGPIIDNEGYAFLDAQVMRSGATDKGHHLNVESWSWGTGSARGPRQTTARVTGIATDPPDANAGTLTIRGRFPDCAVGQRYGGMQFAGGGKIYELTDVSVTRCPTGSEGDIGVTYRKVTVKGWNPETKEL